MQLCQCSADAMLASLLLAHPSSWLCLISVAFCILFVTSRPVPSPTLPEAQSYLVPPLGLPVDILVTPDLTGSQLTWGCPGPGFAHLCSPLALNCGGCPLTHCLSPPQECQLHTGRDFVHFVHCSGPMPRAVPGTEEPSGNI
jgi:hypothetical protein